MVSSIIFLMIHNISYYKVSFYRGCRNSLAGLAVSLCYIETTLSGWVLGAGFISLRVCLETRWLGQNGGFYVPE